MALEKEINVYLLDQLDLIEDVLEVAEKEGQQKRSSFLRKEKNSWRGNYISSRHW